MRDSKQLNLLTSLRFFAAAWVFFDHFGKDIFASAPFFMRCLLPHGRMAVTFFFILSGFVLAYSNTSGGQLRKTGGQFLLARFARIYPVYFFSLLIPLPNKLWAVMSAHKDGMEFLCLPYVLTMTQAWFASMAAAWNPPAWSLSVEALFYLSFPLLLKAFARIPRVHLLVGSTVLLAAGECLRATLFENYPRASVFFPPLSLPQFIFGIALGLYFLQSRPTAQRQGLLLFGLAGLVLYLAIFSYSPGTSLAVLPLAGLAFGAIIFSAASLSGKSLAFLSPPFLVLLGESSYGFYITHMPVMIGFQRVVGLLGVRTPAANCAVLAAGFCFCTVLSIGVHFFLERPARLWILRRSQGVTVPVVPAPCRGES